MLMFRDKYKAMADRMVHTTEKWERESVGTSNLFMGVMQRETTMVDTQNESFIIPNIQWSI